MLTFVFYFMQMLDSLDYSKKLKNNKMQNAKLDLDCILKISKKSVNDMVYINTCVQKIFELFLEYLSNQSHSIAFPELVFQSTLKVNNFYTCCQIFYTFVLILKIRKFIKQCTVASHAKQMQQLLAKIEETSNYIEKTRKTVNFAVNDTDAIVSTCNIKMNCITKLAKHFCSFRMNGKE